jgi:broad specificity phosphatase PhoE
MTAEEIAARHPEFWARRERGEHEGFPNGEPRVDFAARVQAVARELAVGADEDVIVVSHHGTTRQILRALLGVPQGNGDQFAVRLGSLTVARRAGAWSLDVFDLVV